jgi:hypothetical protein
VEVIHDDAGYLNPTPDSTRSPTAGPLLDRTELENGLAIHVPPHRLPPG